MRKQPRRSQPVGEARDAEIAILSDPDRVAAVRETGLTAAPDPAMDRFAAMARVQLRVPVSLVALVDVDRQVFPGLQGLAEPWATDRQARLADSLCQHVVTTGEPLVLVDARTAPRLRDSLAIADLTVVAYAGMPLTDATGQVLGSLVAIDTEPRQWSEAELVTLADLAAMCSTELRLRLVSRQTERERDRNQELTSLLRVSSSHNELLLNAAQALAGAGTLEQIRHQVTDLVTAQHSPDYVGLVVTEPGGVLRRVADPRRPHAFETGTYERFDVDAPLLSAQVVRERRLIAYTDPDSLARDIPAENMNVLRDLGLYAVAAAPLVGAQEILGVLIFGWNTPHPIDAGERVVITTIATYTALALERVRHLEQRISVARQMQLAMLTDLPDIPGVAMAARYLPSAADEAVGGDWYDAVPVPHPGQPGNRALAVTVGDITGHDVRASTLMGQVRSMLRQAAWCLPGNPPSAVVESLETALAGLPVPAHGSLLHAHLLRHRDEPGRWTLRYTNAGHPPPIVLTPDGATQVLYPHDALFGFPGAQPTPRTDHDVLLEPGSTVFLYTDGLVEHRRTDLDEATADLCALLGGLADQPPQRIVDTAISLLIGDVHNDDDIVALAISV